ncbi:unnamed protein product [Rotaria sordida]|uniref:Protein kinase domain-containing protein n=1 Tax=Rotaria sordida TaxID=392033 RepID=A0A819WHU3_9BILA|nr:unnamed protein product [Rotaria sordida]CAF4126118.1 unnamed protein product [Rotaria sordida]
MDILSHLHDLNILQLYDAYETDKMLAIGLDKHIVHLDIKSDNVSIDDRHNSICVQLLGFSNAHHLTGSTNKLIIHRYPISLHTDIWNIGILTYLLLDSQTPIIDSNDFETLQNIRVYSRQLHDREYRRTLTRPLPTISDIASMKGDLESDEVSFDEYDHAIHHRPSSADEEHLTSSSYLLSMADANFAIRMGGYRRSSYQNRYASSEYLSALPVAPVERFPARDTVKKRLHRRTSKSPAHGYGLSAKYGSTSRLSPFSAGITRAPTFTREFQAQGLATVFKEKLVDKSFIIGSTVIYSPLYDANNKINVFHVNCKAREDLNWTQSTFTNKESALIHGLKSSSSTYYHFCVSFINRMDISAYS